MTKLLGGFAVIVMGVLGAAVTSCALDTEGLFAANNEEASCGDICVEAAAGQTGDAGPDAEWPDVIEVPDVCDCGPEGSAGAGGQGGTAGFGGEGGSAGVGGTAGAGGEGGQGGTAGAGGEGGSAGSGGTAAVCGNNTVEASEVCDGTDLNGNHCETLAGTYTGGTLACKGDCTDYDTAECLTLETCTATAGQTATSFYASVENAFGALLHKAEGADEYWSVSPQNHVLVGATLPAQVVGTGKDSLDVRVYMGGVPLDTKWFKVDVATLPGACSGAQINSQNCLALVAKSHRCQSPQFQEKVGCPLPITFVEQTATTEIYMTETVQMMILVDIDCP